MLGEVAVQDGTICAMRAHDNSSAFTVLHDCFTDTGGVMPTMIVDSSLLMTR